MKTVVRSLLIAMAVLVIGCIAFGGVLVASGWRAFVVHTGSMTPNIPSGDLVIDRPAGPVHVRQVITFAKAPGQYVTHRVAAITPEGIQTRGTPTRATTSGTSPSPRSWVGLRRGPLRRVRGGVLLHPAGVVGLVLLMGAIGLAWSLFLGKDNSQKDLRSSSAPSV